MRKHCNFILPRPFIILSSKGLKRNNYRKYIIYPDLSRFKKACFNCHYRIVKNKQSTCLIGNKDFHLKYYGKTASDGILVCLGSVPGDIRSRAIGREVLDYLAYHVQKSNGRASKLYKK